MVGDRTIIVDKIVAKGLLENWLKVLVDSTEGIDNPEMRIELVKQQEQLAAEQAELDVEEE